MATTTIGKDREKENNKKEETTTAHIPIPPAKVKQAVMVANVTLRGLKALLMSSDKEMHLSEIQDPVKLVKLKGEKTNLRLEAEKRAYRRDNHGWTGPLGIPAKCLKRNLIEACKLAEFQTEKGKKMRGGISMPQKIKGSVEIDPGFVLLIHTDGSPVEDYVVNSEKVRIAATKGAIIRYRPQIDDWGIRFQIKWNPHLYGVSEGILEHLLNKGGQLGLLDNRPEFGVYDCVEFELTPESKRMSADMRQGNNNGGSSNNKDNKGGDDGTSAATPAITNHKK